MTPLFKELFSELHKSVSEQGHPFRYATLGTQNTTGVGLRTVVIRKVTDLITVIFYTDARSKKVEEMLANNNVSLLLLNAQEGIQLKLDGKAEVTTNADDLKVEWKAIPEHLKKEYTSALAPGTILMNQGKQEFLKGKNHFCKVAVTLDTIEYLKLQKTHHLKMLFTKKEGAWQEMFLVP